MESHDWRAAISAVRSNSAWIAFAAGAALLQLTPWLPGAWTLAAALLVALGMARGVRRVWPVVLWLGVTWFAWRAGQLLDTQLPTGLEGRDVTVVGVIANLPRRSGRTTRFEFVLDTPSEIGSSGPRRLRLAWYGAHPELVAGDRWQLRLRLKRAHGFRNPGAFDYEGWLFRRGIRATGYVRTDPENRRLGQADHPLARLQRLRQRLAERIGVVLDGSQQIGLLTALALGERASVSDAQWRVLRDTGTNHLVAISGLHLGLVVALLFAVIKRLWPCAAWLALRLPAPQAAAALTLPAAAAYAALAGFSVPTQRALVMIAVLMGALLLRRALAPGRALVLALVGVTLLDPLALGTPGFWLSFGAVAVILLLVTGRRSARRGVGWGRVQLALTVGLAPLLVLQFQQLPVTAPLANLLAVPFVGLLLVPLVLVATLLLLPWPTLGTALLQFAAWLLDLAWPLLAVLAEQPWATVHFAEPPMVYAALGTVGVMFLLAPRGVPLRIPGLIMVLPLLCYKPPSPAHGTAWLTMLDVGQGLAVAVRTERHLLLFDTGPSYSQRFDAGHAALLPFVRRLGRGGLDGLVVSHGDSDHSGGLATVARELRLGAVYFGGGGEPPLAAARPCRAGDGWRWDGVTFTFLHPPWRDGSATGNDASCVLRIVAGGHSALLTGDIEAPAEQVLLAAGPGVLRSDLLQVPHHGSRTSSTAAFLDAVMPSLALVSSGYRNRFGFPNERVLGRYHERGVEIVNTAVAGAVEVRLGVADGPLQARSWRDVEKRFWDPW